MKRLSPKVIVTYIDNSPIFHLVCKECKDIVFIAIQNGYRGLYAVNDDLVHKSHQYYIDEYYCYGLKTKKLFDNFNQKNIKKYFFKGSLKGGIFFKDNKKELLALRKIDICYISEWQQDNTSLYKLNIFKNHQSAIIKILKLLYTYSKENNLNICVALRSNKIEESNFYKKYLGNKVILYEQDATSFSSYYAVSKSKLIVALHSSLAIEALGAGYKVLFINPFGEENYKILSNKCPFYLSKPSYEQFSLKISSLISKSDDRFKNAYKDYINQIISFDRKNLLHDVLRKRISVILTDQ